MNLSLALESHVVSRCSGSSKRFHRGVVPAAIAAFLAVAGCGSGSNGSGTQPGPPPNATPPTNLAYAKTSLLARVGSSITPDTPTVTGNVSGYAVSPALPAGLTINATTGAIAGTPSAPFAQTIYTVTASNSGGSTTAQIQIKVLEGPSTLVNLGHSNPITDLRMDGNHVLSTDTSGHWVLWNYASGSMIASGDGAGIPHSSDKYIAIAGPVMAILYQANLNIYSTADGHLIVTVAAGRWFKVASDGSYVAVGSSSGLAVYSAAGTLVFTHPGDYSSALAFAGVTQVRVANGPAGSNLIENIDAASGTSSVTPSFAGSFTSWFNDGQRFLTRLDSSSTTSVLTYSASGAQQGLLNLSYSPIAVTNLAGQGNWISFVTWTGSAVSLQLYAVGDMKATKTYPMPMSGFEVMSSGLELLVWDEAPEQLSVIDLAGTAPTKTDSSLPSPLHFAQNFAANSASQWVAACNDSVVVDGASINHTPHLFNYGAAASIVAAGNLAAIATQSGQILIYDVSAPTLKGSIPLFATKLAISTDGSLLAGANLGNLDADRNLHLYSLPSMVPVSNLSIADSSGGTPGLLDFSLSGSGTELGVLAGPRTCCTSGPPNTAELMKTDGTGIVSLAAAGPSAPLLSPDGTVAVVSNSIPGTFIQEGAQMTIYKNGLPGTTVTDSLAEVWIDNNNLLAAEFAPTVLGSLYPYLNSAIMNTSGETTVTFKANQIPVTATPSLIQGGSVYIPDSNAIYSLTAGDTTFQGPSDFLLHPVGAVGSSIVVYESTNGTVRIEPFQ